MKKIKDIIRKACALGIGMSMLFTYTPCHAAESATRFSDIPAGAWYAPHAALCTEKGIMEADENGAFRPDDILSVADLVVMTARLWAISGEHEEDDFEHEITDEIWFPDTGDALTNESVIHYREVLHYVCQRAHGTLGSIEMRLKKTGRSATDTLAIRDDVCQLLGISMHSTVYRRMWTPEADGLEYDAYTMYMTGIMEGTDNGFELERPLPRREAAAFFARYLHPELRYPTEVRNVRQSDEVAEIKLAFSSFGRIFLEFKLDVLNGVLWKYEMKTQDEKNDRNIETNIGRRPGRDPKAKNEGYQTHTELSGESLSAFMKSEALAKVLTWGDYYKEARVFDGLQWQYTFTFCDDSEWSVYGSNAFPNGWNKFWDAFVELAGLTDGYSQWGVEENG